MFTGIHIEQCQNVRINGGSITGADIAIDVVNSRDVNVSGMRFSDVGTGIRANGVVGLVAASNQLFSTNMDTKVSFPDGATFKLRPSAILVRQYLHCL